MALDPIRIASKYVTTGGDTLSDTKNNAIEVKKDTPVDRPSIPSIILNILIIVNIQTIVIKNANQSLKNIVIFLELSRCMENQIH